MQISTLNRSPLLCKLNQVLLADVKTSIEMKWQMFYSRELEKTLPIPNVMKVDVDVVAGLLDEDCFWP